MLTKEYLKNILSELQQVTCINEQLFEANGYDGVIEVLNNLRGIEFPCFVIEKKNSGVFQIIEGALDTYTQSLWIMGQIERDEEEKNTSQLLDEMFHLMCDVIRLIIRDDLSGVLPGVDLSHISYNKRMGGPKCRGYEINLTFNDNISLVI